MGAAINSERYELLIGFPGLGLFDLPEYPQDIYAALISCSPEAAPIYEDDGIVGRSQ